MVSTRTSRETFRRTWLTLAPDYMFAGSVSLVVGLATRRFGLQDSWEGLVLTALPIAWATWRTLHWVTCTWEATADGRLVVREGLLPRRRNVIHLCSARQVQIESPVLLGWLKTGHITFQATDQQGQLKLFHWAWISQHRRLYEIIDARGRAELSNSSKWPILRWTVKWLAHTLLTWSALGWAKMEEIATRLQGRWFVDDYGRFLAFCNYLLRTTERGQWPPPRIPRAVVKRWMAVLRQARVAVDTPDGKDWQIAPAIQSLDDICRRVGEAELQRAVQKAAYPVMQPRWAA